MTVISGSKLRDAQMQMDRARAEYEKKRQDVAVKLQLLDENRIKVMRQQLVLLHSATGKLNDIMTSFLVDDAS